MSHSRLRQPLAPKSRQTHRPMTPENISTIASCEGSMPSHWRDDFALPEPFLTIVRGLMSLSLSMTLGHSSLEPVWEICLAGGKEWVEFKDRVYDRITNLIVFGGLLLSASAAFMTTEPPVNGLLDYNQRWPYILMCLSLNLSLCGLVEGCVVVYVTASCSARWFQDSLMSSRSRIMCTLIIIMYPGASIGVSTFTFAFSLLISLLLSGSQILRVCIAMMWAMQLSLIPLFFFTQYPLLSLLRRGFR
ncbi:hypothetical protein AB1N83_013057 [Pleurotus pulmonarius]